MIDLNETFATKIAILVSTDDSPEFPQRKRQMLEKMQGMAQFNQVYDKNLASSNSIYQLLETQKINLLSQQAANSNHKILIMAGYIGHGIWQNQSLHTFNNAQKRVLDIESALRTCAQMPNVYVLGLFDSCR